LEDERQKAEETKQLREEQLGNYIKEEQELGRIANEMVARLNKKTFVDPNNLDYEIEKMLDKVVNYNRVVDPNGILNKTTKKIQE
jgi:hypothetical protein